MPTQEKHQPNANPTPEQLERRDLAIGDALIHQLGQPEGWYRVQVRQVWEDHYRVNVLIGDPLIGSRIAHSYFLTADPAGHILTSDPQLSKQYRGSHQDVKHPSR